MSNPILSPQILTPKFQASQLLTKYEQKISSVVAHQTSLLSTEIDHVKTILRQNEDQLIKQKLAIDDLAEKVGLIQTRTQTKITLLSKQLQNFRKYYDQCYKYTISRINEISQRSQHFALQLQKQVQQTSLAPAIQYVKYTNQMVVSILKGCALKNQEIRYYVDYELAGLEFQMGKFGGYFQDMQDIENQIKIVRYGSQSLKEALESGVKMVSEASEPEMRDSQMGRKLVNYFQPKFKEILKRINGYSMEIQMVKLMANSDAKQAKSQTENKQKQMKDLEQKLTELETAFEQQKKQYERQLAKKQQTLKKRHDRMIQLQQSLHKMHEKELAMQNQISELKMHNLDYSKEVKGLTLKIQQLSANLQERSQARKKEISKEKGFEEKFLILEIEHENLLKKYYAVQASLQSIKNKIKKGEASLESTTNLSKSQKLIRIQPQLQLQPQSPKHTRDHSLTKPLKHSLPKTTTQKNLTLKSSIKLSKTNEYEVDMLNMYQQNQRLARDNKQLVKINKSLQEEINIFIEAKAKQNREDQEYLDMVQAEVEKNLAEIGRLQKINLELTRKNNQLVVENEKLEDELNEELEKYQAKCKSYKNIVFQLQKKIQILTNKNQELVAHLRQYETDSDLTEPRSATFGILSPQGSKLQISSPSQDMKISGGKERRPRKSSNFLVHLQNAITGMGLPVPICCELDKNGFIRERKTGNYLVDPNKNPMRISEAELKAAQDSGLILI